MKLIQIIVQIALLYVFYFIGEWVQRMLHVPIPGSIIGLFLLLAVLLSKVFSVRWIEAGTGFLLTYLPLFIVPATVGVINYSSLFAGNGTALVGIVVISTLLVMIIAAHTSQLSAAAIQKRKEKKACQDHLSQSL